MLLYKGLKGKARIPKDDIIPNIRHCGNQMVSMPFRCHLLHIIKTPIKMASFLELSGIGMTSLIL